MQRCIYTGEILRQGDKDLRPSLEHIVPLSLGGSDQLTTRDVCAAANARAGKMIDDAAASLMPFIALRQRYGLKGNRGKVPHFKLKGVFTDLDSAKAELSIDPDAGLSVTFDNEKSQVGQVLSFSTTIERFRFLMKARLQQARERKLSIMTPFGAIQDEEDIEIAILLGDVREGREFAGRVSFDLFTFHDAVVRLMLKIALGLGHTVLGPTWTFSPQGDQLRLALWSSLKDPSRPQIRGTWRESFAPAVDRILRVGPDKHVLAVLPGKITSAYVSLFGGEMGVGVIDLGVNTEHLLESFGSEVGCAFEIPLHSDVRRRILVRRTFQQVANAAAEAGDLGDDLSRGPS